MPEIKNKFRRNRFFLEILGIVVVAEFALMVVFERLPPALNPMLLNLLDALTLTLLIAPFIFWRSRAAEANLRESETLRHTIDTHAIVSVADRGGRITDANPAFCAISGYSREQLLGQDHRMLNSGTHSPEFWNSMWGDIARGMPWRGEICNRNAQGQTYWVDSMIAPYLGAHGLVEKYVSVRMDITARKVAQEELAHQTRLLAEVVEAAPYGMAVYDAQRVLRLHNAQFAKMLELPPALLEQQPFRLASQVHYQYARGDYGNTQSVETVLSEFENAMAASKHLTLERMQSNGRHIELRAYPISDGWTVLNYRDNTARKLQQLKLMDAQERVRLATESAGIGIWSLHTVTGQQTWDAQQYRLFGLPYDPDPGAPIYDLWSGHLHPEDAKRAEATFQKSLQDGVPFDHVFRIIRPDGAVRHIKALGSPRLDAAGRVEYIVGTNMDVTDAMLLAQSMQEARDRAEEATLAKNQFMANMSHEIRTPMNAVLGMLKLLGRSELNTLQRGYISNAERASRMMVHLVDDILEHTQLRSGIVVLRPNRFHLDEVLQPLSDLVLFSLEGKDISLRFELDPQLPDALFGDKKRLLQVLTNLLGNAIKFTLAGEVVCRIHRQEQQAGCSRLTFCVQDTGIGIAPEFRDRIFQSFTQVQTSSTRAFGGAGLGLPISQRLVELMGGSIVLESEVGVGSSFSFTLDLGLSDDDRADPASRLVPARAHQALARTPSDGQDAAVAAQQERPQRLKGLRVLAVDDVQINQTVIAELLKSEGALVTLADNGRLGVDAVLSVTPGHAFDVVLMDIQMPVMDGYEATRLIRCVPQWAQLPIIAVTANVLESDRAKCLAAGMNHHLAKPYDLDELVAVICSVTGMQAPTPTALPAAAGQLAAAPVPMTRSLYAYWVRTQALQAAPDAAAWLQQGVVLRVLESLEALALLLEEGAPAGLLVLDLETATSAAWRALGRRSIGASMKAMPLIALADAPTEEEMRACRRAGAVDSVPTAFALKHLKLLGNRFLNEHGEPQTDLHQEIAAIRSAPAMAHMQADVPFFGSLLRAFLDELPARKQQIQSDWYRDPQQVKHHSHALKGLAMTLGLQHLADAAVHTETLATQTAALNTDLLVQLEGEMQSAGFQILRWLHLHKDVLETTP
jgi:PAS domain S-box-containing protein